MIIHEKLAPQSFFIAALINNLGAIALERRNLVVAEDYYQRSLALHEKEAPQSLRVATGLSSLGLVANARGDLAAAEDYYRRALAIREMLAPRSIETAMSLNNLGTVVGARGDVAAAESLLQRALGIWQQLVPQSLSVAMALNNLGSVAVDRKALGAAEDHLRRALDIYDKVAPRSIDAAETLHLLGTALANSDPDTAEAHFQRALAIRRDRAPGSSKEAESCHRLAVLHRRQNQLDKALEFYVCAVEALEAQKGKLGGSDEVRSNFGAKYAGIYRETIALLVELGKTDEAFHLLERYRARELLALLAERDLVFSVDIPKELETRRRFANRSYDQAFGQWMQLSDRADAEELQQAREELSQARLQQDQVRAEIRAASPRLAALQDPRTFERHRSAGGSRFRDPVAVLFDRRGGKLPLCHRSADR